MALPRLIIAGLSGDSGKTLLACGLLSSFRYKGMNTTAFKKGPDYIDPAWLSLASGTPTRNLDTYLMKKEVILSSFLTHSKGKHITIIEGNRGLFDGFDAKGLHSTAELAKLLNAPVLLIFNIGKMTRTAAALVLGCTNLDKDLNIGGIILNNSAGSRHEKVAKEAIEDITGIPVVGVIPKLRSDIFPSRHLGLVTPGEYRQAESAIEEARKVIESYIDTDKILDIAKNSELVNIDKFNIESLISKKENPKHIIDNHILHNDQRLTINDKRLTRIGYFFDKAFSFYYPENLEALRKQGAVLVPISSINDSQLPEIDGLYIGGGFPESNIEELVNNSRMLNAVKKAAFDGLPIYAECGGLIYLAEALDFGTFEYSLSGVLPIKINMNEKPQGHGYMEVCADIDNPIFEKGTVIRGHEFHYSAISEVIGGINTAFRVDRGGGALSGRDGLFSKNIFATYMHIHALSVPEWAEGFIKLVKKHKIHH